MEEVAKKSKKKRPVMCESGRRGRLIWSRALTLTPSITHKGEVESLLSVVNTAENLQTI
ncbi:hypothetical protein N482_09210 [Pseudoalteromonas luteoviolacea NCIMB 1942]|uniref:Uncharacterized protein n=1 Tax=Pseudoalteromonas luteoviolacea NCIMB 1942 TaxID=1365253 RepID=A0A167CL79_9GAMM|nr:hypothetical protein N482_09210 [Pseudoalteromonas luteoviolacea NCIMB 1942]